MDEKNDDWIELLNAAPGHREHKTPAPLRIGHPATRLTKWIKRETWTPDEAALLVLGFDPDSKRTSPLGFAMIMGLCGGSYTFDVLQRDQQLSIEGRAKQIAEDWRRRVNASERVNLSEFVGWCLERGVNADWLREVRLPPELTYTALVHAADLLARRTWSPENLPLALRTVLADGWVVRELTAAEMSRPGTGTEKVIYSEADALSIMQGLERPKLQRKIDALLSLGKLPLYEWPSRIPTKERDGAHVKEADLIALLTDGQHLVASQQAVAPPAPHSAPLAAPVESDSTTPSPAPVVQGLETREIANAFDDVLGWPADRWTKNLSAAKWAEPARVARGEQGGASALWNPLILARQLHNKKADMKVVAGRFSRIPALEPWRDAFNEYFATYCAGD